MNKPQGEWSALAYWLTYISEEELSKLSPFMKEQVEKARNHITDSDRWNHVLARMEYSDGFYEGVEGWTIDPDDVEGGFSSAAEREDFKAEVDRAILYQRRRARERKNAETPRRNAIYTPPVPADGQWLAGFFLPNPVEVKEE